MRATREYAPLEPITPVKTRRQKHLGHAAAAPTVTCGQEMGGCNSASQNAEAIDVVSSSIRKLGMPKEERTDSDLQNGKSSVSIGVERGERL